MSVDSGRCDPSQQQSALPEFSEGQHQVEAEFGDVNVAAEVDC
jgi:hypothetical protein